MVNLLCFKCENKNCSIYFIFQKYDEIINKKRYCPCCLELMVKVKQWKISYINSYSKGEIDLKGETDVS